MNADDKQTDIIERLRVGDNAVIKSMYKDYFAYCASCVLNNNGTQEDAREIFQKSMIVLLEKARDPSFSIKHTVKSYLYAITRNQWFKELKRSGKMTTMVDEEGKDMELIDDDSALLMKKEQEERLQQIHEVMQRISAECQKLLQLTFFKKMKDKEIAPLMNYSLVFVRNKRRRCIKGIKGQLGVG